MIKTPGQDFDPVQFPHRELTERIIRCFYDVYNELGFGFLESVYHSAMLVALEAAGLRAEKEVKLRVYFRGREIAYFEADIFVENVVILELKAVKHLAPEHEEQRLNYWFTSELRTETRHQTAGVQQRAQARPPIVID